MSKGPKALGAEVVEKTTPKNTWFILNRKRDNFGIQMECQKTNINSVTGHREVNEGSENRCLMFDCGFYATDKEDEIEFLSNHALGSGMGVTSDSYRKCLESEIASIKHFVDHGTPRKEWHDRIKAIEKAMSGANK